MPVPAVESPGPGVSPAILAAAAAAPFPCLPAAGPATCLAGCLPTVAAGAAPSSEESSSEELPAAFTRTGLAAGTPPNGGARSACGAAHSSLAATLPEGAGALPPRPRCSQNPRELDRGRGSLLPAACLLGAGAAGVLVRAVGFAGGSAEAGTEGGATFGSPGSPCVEACFPASPGTACLPGELWGGGPGSEGWVGARGIPPGTCLPLGGWSGLDSASGPQLTPGFGNRRADQVKLQCAPAGGIGTAGSSIT